KNKIKFLSNYLFPQTYFIFSLIIFLLFFSKLWFLSLIFLLPLPSPGRKELELRGYKANLLGVHIVMNLKSISKEEQKNKFNNIINELNKEFIGPSYYFMWPFGVKKELNIIVDDLLNNKINYYDFPYNLIRMYIEEVLLDYNLKK